MKVELFREIDGHFLPNEHGDPHLLHVYIYIQSGQCSQCQMKKVAEIYDQIFHSLKKSDEKSYLG